MDKTNNVEVREPRAGQKEMVFLLPAAIVEDEFSRVYSELGRTRVLKGFRPGKAPRRVLEKHFGKEARSEAIGNLIASHSSRTIKEHKIEAVGDPVVSDIELKADNTLNFVVSVDLRPRVELGEWKGIPLKKGKTDVSEEEVERELANLRRSAASFEPVEARPLRADDWALVTLHTPGRTEDGRSEPTLLEMGRVSEELRSQLVGLNPGEKRVLKNSEPGKREGADPAAETEVELKEIKKMVLPDADDEWARGIGGCESLAQLKETIRKAIKSRKESAVAADLESQALRHLLSRVRVQPPPRALERITEEYLRKTGERGGKEAPASTDPNSDGKLREEARRRAEEDLKVHFILEELADRENIEVTDEILNREFEGLALRYGVTPAMVREQIEKRGDLDGFKERIKKRMAIARVVEAAAVKEID